MVFLNVTVDGFPNYGISNSKQKSMILFSSLVFSYFWKILDVFLHMSAFFYRKVLFNPV